MDAMDMEKGNLDHPAIADIPPLPSARDILRPLSQDGIFLSSGAVAAQALKLMQTDKASPSSPETSPPLHLGSDQRDQIGATVQKCSEVVQQICEKDGDGVRTWRRVVMEYS
ncbi:hypothetical protein PDE_00144 [Penicillium oxalicum 114-2]|uniref:Uncharacterized protein n=1 Tax=Penicillium oxalicum (strain 114-2 / CGMCC 5302) TaxID=933388 RepID=S8ATQ5_PENO1|nr:hypothetical protein PDE_00144 [Penicillium oxalicum 114-2]